VSLILVEIAVKLCESWVICTGTEWPWYCLPRLLMGSFPVTPALYGARNQISS
jgi:hypothetical protein